MLLKLHQLADGNWMDHESYLELSEGGYYDHQLPHIDQTYLIDTTKTDLDPEQLSDFILDLNEKEQSLPDWITTHK